MHHVYILRCADKRLYVGCTNDIKDRIHRHKLGQIKATKSRLPAKLIAFTSFADKYKAYEFEKYLKSGSGRAFAKRHFLGE